jgi:Fe2+ transport system protein FeoA
LCRFFEDVLELSHDEADATACKVEHDINENVLNKLIVLTEVLAGDDDAKVLRKKLNEKFAALPEPMPPEELTSLNDLQDGQTGTIAYVSTSLKGMKKFADMGLVPGAVLTLEGRAPLGDLLRIRLLDSVISLRGSDGAFILLKNVQ